MFQVILSIIIFWYVVVPITKKSVDTTVKNILDNNMNLTKEKLVLPENVVFHKEYLLDFLSKKDQYAFEQNTQVVKTTFIIIIVVSFICFTLMFLFACNQNPLPMIYELMFEYSIILIAQILFIVFVLNKFTPVTYNQIIEFISNALNEGCLKE